MKHETSLEDIVGLNHTRLGYFPELQARNRQLHASNRELENRQRQIQAILDGITDVMAVVGLDFRILSVNNVFFDVYGKKNPEGRLCYKVFRGQDKPCEDCPLVAARDTGEVYRKLDIYPVGGKNHHFEITASPLKGPDRKPTKVLLMIRDVTHEKELQAQYNHAEKMATIGLLAAGVAHEINNPLTGISGFAEGLSRRLPKLDALLGEQEGACELREDFSEYVETIREECERCRKIVRNLLTFSPRKNPEFSPVDLNRLTTDVLKLLRHRLRQYPKDRIRMDLSERLPKARGIAAELKQVVLNLVLNALDAVDAMREMAGMDDRGTLHIQTLFTQQGSIHLVIKDDGCGIPKEYHDKLFEPFFTTKPVGQGIGIGLSTCYNIIKQHHGRILVDSRENEGTTFTVMLPPYRSQEEI